MLCFCDFSDPLLVVLPSFSSCIISFIASVVLLMSASICLVWVSFMCLAISSSVAAACSSIMFALNCFAVSLFCLFSFAYSTEMKVLMLFHVLFAVGLFSHSRTAASNSPDDLKKYNAMSLRSFRSDVIPARVSALIACSTLLKYFWGFSLISHSASLSAMSFLVSVKSSEPPRDFKWSSLSLFSSDYLFMSICF